jgi:hypothetical protein
MKKLLWVGAMLAATAAWAQGTELVGNWTNAGGSFVFNRDGSAQMTVGQQRQTGTWTVDGQQLWLNLQGGQLVFAFQQQGDQLLLQDANGQYLLQRTAKPAEPAPQSRGSAGGAAAPVSLLNTRQFLGFIEHYAAMRPDDVYDHLMRTTAEQRQMIQLHGALEQALCYRACQSPQGAGLVWSTMSGAMDCAHVAALRAQHLEMFASMGMSGDPFMQAETERLQMVNHYKCVLKMHPADLCAAYYRTLSEISRRQHETSMGIIDNIGSSGCTEHWEEDANGDRTYLGCW